MALTPILVDGQAQNPSRILCIGRNYVAHIEELGNEVPEQMVVFAKPATAIADTLHSALGGEALHYEGELAFTVQGGEPAAVAFGLDLTKRALQSRLKEKGLPWERAKAFDGAALFSEFVTLAGSVDDLSLRLTVNGELRQAGGVELMMYKPQAILAELATFTSVLDGDIIMTGTPAGVGEVRPGDRFAAEVQLGAKTLVEASWIAL